MAHKNRFLRIVASLLLALLIGLGYAAFAFINGIIAADVMIDSTTMPHPRPTKSASLRKNHLYASIIVSNISPTHSRATTLFVCF